MGFAAPGTVNTSGVPLASAQGLYDEGAKVLQDWWWVGVIVVIAIVLLLAFHK